MLDFDYTNFTGYQDLSKDRTELVDAQGRMRKANLFLETHDGSKNYQPMYTLRDHERNELPSAYLIYMTSVDEYDAAAKLVGSQRHWRKLLDTSWFSKGIPEKGFEGLDQWRLDMQARDASTGKGALMKQVKKGDTSAARKIIDMAKPATAPKVGRPGTKADKEAQAAEKARAERTARIEKAAQERAERDAT